MTDKHSHDSLVKGLIDYFQKMGLEIRFANYKGYSKPIVIKRHAPDVLAIDKEAGLAYIGEAKLCSELYDQITKEQFEDYPKRIIKNGRSAGKLMQFYIGVPQECHTKIKDIFKESEIPWKDNIQVLGL